MRMMDLSKGTENDSQQVHDYLKQFKVPLFISCKAGSQVHNWELKCVELLAVCVQFNIIINNIFF